MPKKKTSKSAAKRVKITASGKFKFRRPGRGHLLSCKSRKRKRALRKDGVLSPDGAKHIREMLYS
jgi:large subunit ribosomal protein L35